jgi:hypothetical protein
MVSIVVVIVPQILIPAADRFGPPLVVPIVEAVVFLIMLSITARPGPVPRSARPLVLALFGLLVVANAAAAVRLMQIVLRGETYNAGVVSSGRLLVAGAMLLATNVITFGLVYWELNAGGPAGRLADPPPLPDFLFPQLGDSKLAPAGWQPRFADHLYLSYTNLVAFSPTDTLPLTIRAKALMMVQSLISVSVLVVVLARVINILPT